MKKEFYCKPETESLDIRFKENVLTASIPDGAQIEGFDLKGDYSDSQWDIS